MLRSDKNALHPSSRQQRNVSLFVFQRVRNDFMVYSALSITYDESTFRSLQLETHPNYFILSFFNVTVCILIGCFVVFGPELWSDWTEEGFCPNQ